MSNPQRPSDNAVGVNATNNPGDEAPAGSTGTGENICPRCSGTGRLGGRDCPDCAGSGKITSGIGGG